MNEKASVLQKLSQAVLFQRIGDICAVVNIAVDTQELLSESLDLTLDLFAAKRGSIFILSDDEQELVLRVARGMKSVERETMVKKMGEGIVGRVALSKKPIIVKDISTDTQFGKYKARQSYRTNSFICVPFILKDQLIGVINITDKETGHGFNEDELQLLDFLGSQIALNYHRIRLYKKFKTIVAESQSLKDRLGQSNQETAHLKKQIHIHEKLATIGKLAGGIAHEFNNPLDGVMRYTNLSLEHIKDDEIVRGYLLEIKQGLKRMANIVKNLLACSREGIPQQRQKINFENALDKVLYGSKGQLESKNIIVKKKIEKNLPEISDQGLEQILSNLIRNAVDAMDNGGYLTIEARTVHHALVFSVTDTGIGIPEDKHHEIFEPFYTTKEMEKGCGLGLTIVAEIIKSYNGKIDLESKLGEETTFTIEIPLTEW